MAEKANGYLAMVLHAHLPFVKHPENQRHLEENWFFEAVIETYLPLLKTFNRLLKEKSRFRLTLSISPTLITMMSDKLLTGRFHQYMGRMFELADKEIQRTRETDHEFHEVARFYYENLHSLYNYYLNELGGDLPQAFKNLAQSGQIELITTPATHGFLPLLSVNPSQVELQIKTGIENHKHFFKQAPRGMWLSENAYYPGLEKVLKKYGLEYFLVDAHGVMHARPTPSNGIFAPVLTNENVYAFARDIESSSQVWSSVSGYPGDHDYREFYRDLGYDMPLDYIRPYIADEGRRTFTGFKYYRITSDSDIKQPYQRQKALQKAQMHAEDFLANRKKQIQFLSGWMTQQPLIVAPYDAELFGHWWFEGPEFLYEVFTACDSADYNIEPVTLSQYLDKNLPVERAQPSASSWGAKGYNEVWLNPSNDWIYPYLHRAFNRLQSLAREYEQASSLENRILNQMARELLLAESSDWAFIMSMNTTSEYAIRRTRNHIDNFVELMQMLQSGQPDIDLLERLEFAHSVFSFIDYKNYNSDHQLT